MCNFDIDLDSIPDEIPMSEIEAKNSLTPKNRNAVPEHLKHEFQKLKTERTQTYFITSCSELADNFKEIGGLQKKKTLNTIITKKSFNAISIIIHLLDQGDISELYITGSAINLKTARAIHDIVNSGKVGKMVFLISSLIMKTETEKINILKALAENNKNFKLIFAWNHTKIITCKTKKGECYTIMGSGNMSNNARIEQYMIVHDDDLHEFHKNWIDNAESFSAKKDVTKYGSL